MKKISEKIILLSIIVFTTLTSLHSEELFIDYPEDYRNWTHIKSMVIQEGHPLHASFGGIHHIYANEKALQGYQQGNFPDGSIIIFDLLAAVIDDTSVTEGTRKVLGVMEKDSSRFKDTSGWGFEGFAKGNATSRAIGKNYKEACYTCHISQKDNDYVFSKWRN